MLKPILSPQHVPVPAAPLTSTPRLTPPVVPPSNPSGDQEEDDFKEHAILLRAKRQEVLASNIANVDTPNYQAVDLDFRASLQRAVSRQKSGDTPPSDLRKTASAHLPGLPGSPFTSTVALSYRVPTQNALDNNSVDMDIERGQFADNAIRFQLALKAYEDEYTEFKAASSSNR